MAHERNTLLGGEDESYFVSMTDLMVGMLFIFIIMLMAFALSLREAEQEQEIKVQELTNAREVRDEMLDTIKSSLEKRGVQVEIDQESGVLRLKADILFKRGESQLTERGEKDIRHVAEVLIMVLRCYAELPGIYRQAPKGGKLEAVFIEGHTDGDKFAEGAGRDNWILSAERAIRTFRELTKNEPDLDNIRNDSSHHLIGVSGYENRRPTKRFEGQTEKEKKDADRRIDLRFIMASPKPPPQIDTEAALETDAAK